MSGKAIKTPQSSPKNTIILWVKWERSEHFASLNKWWISFFYKWSHLKNIGSFGDCYLEIILERRNKNHWLILQKKILQSLKNSFNDVTLKTHILYTKYYNIFTKKIMFIVSIFSSHFLQQDLWFMHSKFVKKQVVLFRKAF